MNWGGRECLEQKGSCPARLVGSASNDGGGAGHGASAPHTPLRNDVTVMLDNWLSLRCAAPGLYLVLWVGDGLRAGVLGREFTLTC